MRHVLVDTLLFATSMVGAQQSCQTVGNSVCCLCGALAGSLSAGDATDYNYSNSRKPRQ